MSKPAVRIAVLAGGRGSRLGGEKASADLGGRPLLHHIIAAARATGLPVVVVAKAATVLPPHDAELLLEPDEPHHPLTGILAALRALPRGEPEAALLAVGCDMPFLTPELLAALAASEGAAALAGERQLQPLPARIPASALDSLDRNLAARGPLRRAIAELQPRLLGPAELATFGDPARLLLNVNDPEGLRAAQRLITAPPEQSAPPPR